MPEAPIAAPPAAASSAPSPVAPPAGAPPPSSAPDNPYAELDALNAADPPPSATRKRERRADPPSEGARGADGKFTKADAKPDPVKTGTQPASGKPSERQAAPTTAPPMRTAELRTRYDETKAKLADLEPKLAQAEKELSELRSRAPDTKPLEDRLTALQQQNAALQEEIRFVNYQKHPEFVAKYQKPYLEAWTKAVNEIGQLNITMEDGSTRQATANDFLALANAPLDQLDDLAAQWFPKATARVVRHVEKVRDLAEQQQAALEQARKGAGDREKAMIEQRKAHNDRVGGVYRQTTAELTQKFPKWFAPEDGDSEGNEILRKGFEYADSVLNGNGQLKPEEKAKRLAIIRAKAASHDRLASRLKSANARIKELEADLAEYEKSAPAGGGEAPAAGKEKGFMEEAMAELASLDRP